MKNSLIRESCTMNDDVMTKIEKGEEWDGLVIWKG